MIVFIIDFQRAVLWKRKYFWSNFDHLKYLFIFKYLLVQGAVQNGLGIPCPLAAKKLSHMTV